MNKIMIKTVKVTRVYGKGIKTQALQGIDIEIKEGEFVAIRGPSGSGKSTLLHLIGGLDKPSSGNIFIDEVEIEGLSHNELARLRCQRIGFVFQFFNLLQNLNSQENVEIAMMFSGVQEKTQQERAKNLLSLVGLSGKLAAKPSELSGGQQQRVAIARAMANDPEILLMDEPTGNLDSKSEAEVLEAILNLHQQGKTVVIITHNNEIAKNAETIFEIRDGMVRGEAQR